MVRKESLRHLSGGCETPKPQVFRIPSILVLNMLSGVHTDLFGNQVHMSPACPHFCPTELGLESSLVKETLHREGNVPEASMSIMFLLFVEGQIPVEMSCQQSQQQCQPQPKCPTSPKCPPKSSAQCSPQAPAGCALGSGSGCGPSSGGSCCLSHHRHHGSHRCWLHSSDPCDSGSERQSGVSGCGHDSRNSC